MKSSPNSFYLFVLVTVFTTRSFLQATSVITTAQGGNPVVGYQTGLVTLVSSSEKVRGHAVLKNGLRAAGPVGMVGIWDADGIVNGPISAGGASQFIGLATDLRLGSTASFSGNDFTIRGNDKTIYLGGDISLNASASSKYFQLSNSAGITFDGRGHVLSFVGASGASRNVAFRGVDSAGTFTFMPSLTLQNVTWIINNGGYVINYACMKITKLVLRNMTIREAGSQDVLSYPGWVGSILIQGDVYLEGKQGSLFDFVTTPIVIDKNSTLHVGKGMTLTNVGSITMTDATSTLHLNGCDFYVGKYDRVSTLSSPGMSITKGRMIFENKVRIFNTYYAYDSGGFTLVTGSINTDPSQGFILGDGTPANDVDVRVLGGAYVTVSGCIDYRHS